MSGKIFINYRRGDDPGFAGRLFDRLEEAFTSERLFMDIDSIEPGHDFVRVLEDQVDHCDIFLAIIGPNWLDAEDDTGSRRLDNENDFVRIEIESGLKLGKRIIPVLVNNAEMPHAEDLPESLMPLARRNAVRLTHDRFKADAQGLIKQLEKALEDAEAARQAATSAAGKEARRLEEASKAAEVERQEKERARLQGTPGLSPEQIARAEELANWEFIKDSESAQEFRDHLARHPKGVTERMARAKLEAIVWDGVDETDLDELGAFLAEFPDGKYAENARKPRDSLKAEADALLEEEERNRSETEAWAAASTADTAEAYEAFLRDWPGSLQTRAARNRLKQLKGGLGWIFLSALGVAGVLGIYTHLVFGHLFPNPLIAAIVPGIVTLVTTLFLLFAAVGHRERVRAEERERVEREDTDELANGEAEAWAAASTSDTAEAYEAFLEEWPESQHARSARIASKLRAWS